MTKSEVTPANVIYRSGQMWKVWLGAALLLGGAVVNVVVAVLLSTQFIDLNSRLLNAQLPSALVSLAGFIYLCMGITCRNCGAKWIWMAVTGKLSGKSVLGLVELNRCPVCGDPGSARRTQA
jgi:hypothetical protein